MQRAACGFVGIASIAGALLSATTALAHIDLLEPEARSHGTAARGDTDVDVNTDQKQGPCGQVVSGRTDRVATYAPGQQITVRVREESPHPSYLRVSLALEGEEFPLRSEPAVATETPEQARAAEAALGGDTLLAVFPESNDTPGFVHEIDVTLPDATCEACTLQVLQFMYDRPAAPFYFQCADLVIAAPEADEGAAPAADAGVADESDESAAANESAAEAAQGATNPIQAAPVMVPSDATSQAAPAAMPAAASASPAASSSGSAPAPSATSSAAAVANDSTDDGGCSLSVGHARSGAGLTGFSGLLLLALAFVRRVRQLR